MQASMTPPSSVSLGRRLAVPVGLTRRVRLSPTIFRLVIGVMEVSHVPACSKSYGMYVVSVRRTRLNVLVLLTLALAGESPTCVLHEGMHTP